MTRGLYIHIPFCLKKCHYCNFVITTQRSDADRGHFFEALRKEIEHAMVTVTEKGDSHPFQTLYLGGGTPSALSGSEMSELFELLHNAFDFAAGSEMSCEVNPGDIDQAKLEIYRALGINRISLGAQAFQESLLQDMNRSHGVQEIVETVSLLKKVGFQNISMDLILRLPGQTLEDLDHSLSRVVQLGASQVSLYDLEVHAKTVYGRRQEEGKLALPPEELHSKMFDRVASYLVRAGYDHYEVSNFARPGFQSKHNLIYWHNQDYLGLGPGAFSYVNGLRYQFASDVKSYLKKCETADWTHETEERPEGKIKEMDTLLTGLRLLHGVSLSQFPLLRPTLEKKLPELIQSGCIKKQEDHFHLTRRGCSLVESVLLELSRD